LRWLTETDEEAESRSIFISLPVRFAALCKAPSESAVADDPRTFPVPDLSLLRRSCSPLGRL